MDRPTSRTGHRGASNAPEAAAGNSSQFITFTLAEQEYGVDIMAIREIKGWIETTSIPHAPDFIRGVINLRGIIVPIMDLRARFGMALTEPTAMHVVIIITLGTRTTGLLVDAVSDIITVAPASIRAIPEMGAGEQESLLTGLVALDDRMVSLVSLERLIGTGGAAPLIHDGMLLAAA
ncbi:chemotaxis protein CheW [Lichenicoccus roseus]|uniref:Purine-binding chemotaxis protein CheW n=1 Tax=Lichenicoccus roseus TaxID=2683649 RepID=A0A5R9J499_9PROT|nr:chemotaxis protein CheW [Lichenicoccus roseus]TLU72450.1 purine-binding chemotaxis protein CheW [Lichenicoccus roseus]